MIVPYSKYMAFLVKDYMPLYNYFQGRDWVFTFEHYVKSQLHLQIVPELYDDRDIFTYVKAYRYLRGEDSCVLECSQALRYFYQDMASMFCTLLQENVNPQTQVSVKASLGRASNLLPTKEVNLSGVITDLQRSLSGDFGGGERFSDGVFVKFKYNQLNDLVPNNVLALAAICAFYGADSEETYVIEVI